MNLIECIREKISQESGLKDELYSLILHGSFVRGDFVENVSDLDFFAVIKGNPEKVVPKLKVLLEKCTQNTKAVEVDLAWEYLENLNDPLNKGYLVKVSSFRAGMQRF